MPDAAGAGAIAAITPCHISPCRRLFTLIAPLPLIAAILMPRHDAATPLFRLIFFADYFRYAAAIIFADAVIFRFHADAAAAIRFMLPRRHDAAAIRLLRHAAAITLP